MTNGHMFSVTYEPNIIKVLGKIASFIKEGTIYDLKNRKIDPENHMIPSFVHEIQASFLYKID